MMKNLNRSFFFLICFVTLLGLGFTSVQAAPPNDDFDSPTSISGDSGTISGNNIGASWDENATPTLVYRDSGTPECKSIWYEWSPTTPGVYYFNTFGSITTSSGSLDTVLSVYTGTTIDNLDTTYEIDNDDYDLPSPGRRQSRLSFSVDVTKTYRIVVDGYGIGHLCPEGYVALNWGLWSAIPLHDNFATPYEIIGSEGTIPGTNINTTPEIVGIEEPSHHPNNEFSFSSIWFKWTAPATGGYFVTDTFGSGFDTIMAVYTGIGPGTTFADLTKVTDNDDADFSTIQSRVSFPATALETYYIVVDGYQGLQGDVVLNWMELPELPPNDDFVSATTISGKTGTTNGYNFFATTETGEPYHGDNTGPYKSIWFKWIAPYSGKSNFDTFGSDYDTTMAVYTGGPVNNLTKLTENDDAGTATQSNIIFPVLSGTTYYIAVDGYEGAQGNVVLNWKKEFSWVLFTPATTGMGN